jgi:glycosyltransferase involved in cell wall biosynthesis
MHIGLSTLILRPGRSASNEPYLVGLIQGMARIPSNHTFHLFVSHDNKHLFSGLPSNWKVIEVSRFWTKNVVTRVFFEQVILAFIAFLRHIDLLHYPGSLGPLVALRPWVVTIHWDFDPIHLPSIPWAKRFYFTIFYGLAARTASKLIMPTQAFAKDFIKRWSVSEGRCAVVYHGVSQLFRLQGNTKENRGYEMHPYLFSVTNSRPHKNLPTLIETFGRLLQKHPMLHLILAGDIDEKYLASERDRFGIAKDQIRIVGFVGPDRLASLYAAASIYLTLSEAESAGLTVIEAMSFGLPVIASNIPSHRELGGDHVIFVESRDAPQIATLCDELLRDEHKRRRTGEQGRAFAARYTWEKTAQGTLAVYEEAASAAK